MFKKSFMKNPDFISNLNLTNPSNVKEINNKLNNNKKIFDSNDEKNQKLNENINKGKQGSISPDQYNLLQGLTNPEQLNKFMKISGILNQQNEEEINLTNNLFLRKSSKRDFEPREWGCRNCPCTIHGNPNIKCDCCGCVLCPNKQEEIYDKEKIKQKIFPKNSNYSYSYTYEM